LFLKFVELAETVLHTLKIITINLSKPGRQSSKVDGPRLMKTGKHIFSVLPVSMITLFELSVCAFFEVGLVCAGPAPDAGEHAVVLAAVKDASLRWRGGPETGHP